MSDMGVNLVDSKEITRGKYLTFAVGDEVYGLEIFYITEIIGIQAITEVPEMPDYVKGILNLRGKVIPIIDVRIRFKKEPQEYNDRTCIMVVDVDNTSIGLIVDTVLEVMDINDKDITDPPSSRSGYKNKYINGIGKTPGGIKLLLDIHRLISDVPDPADAKHGEEE